MLLQFKNSSKSVKFRAKTRFEKDTSVLVTQVLNQTILTLY